MLTLDYIDTMPSNYYIYDWGDIHNPNPAIDLKAIKKYNDLVCSHKHAYGVLGGDLNEYIYHDDKRYQPNIHKGTIFNDELENFKFMFQKIKDKRRMLYIFGGNHEDRHKGKFSPIDFIGQWFDCDYTKMNLVKAIFTEYRICDYHPFSGTLNSNAKDDMMKEFNELLSMKAKLRKLPADDCLLMMSHHWHKVRVFRPSKKPRYISLPPTTKRGHILKGFNSTTEPIRIKNKLSYIHEDDRYYACCGSALRGYVEGISTYIEKRGYEPTEIGCIKIEIKADKVNNVEKVFL